MSVQNPALCYLKSIDATPLARLPTVSTDARKYNSGNTGFGSIKRFLTNMSEHLMFA